SVGRFQFSEENANTVRYSTPRSAQLSTVRTSASTPALCPKKRGMKRFLAQRPLPSMTMATWRGMAGWGSTCSAGARSVRRPRPSDGQDLRFLRGDHAVYLGDGAVGELLHVVERATLVVLADLL